MAAKTKSRGKKVANKDDEALKCITPVGRACFVHVWEPYAFKANDGKSKEPSYRIVLVFDEDTDLQDVKRIVSNAIKKKWGVDEGKRLIKRGKMTMPWRDASDYEEYGEPFDDDGAIMISLSSRSAPGVVDARAKPIMKQQDFYAGCLARASVYAHAYDTLGNMGVTLLLNNVQKAGDGDKLSGRADPTEEFDPLVEDDEDDELADMLG